MKTKSKLLIIGILSIGLSNTLLAKDYGVINGNYTPPSYNSETLSLSTSLREVPKDTYLKIEKDMEKKYQNKYNKDMKDLESKIENRLSKKYDDLKNSKVTENNNKLLEEIKIKDKLIADKEKIIKEFNSLENKVKECEKQKVDTESREIKAKIDKATRKALSDYLTDSTKNKEINYIKNASKERNIENNSLPSFPNENLSTPQKPVETKIDKNSLENDFKLDNFKLENLN